MLLRAGASKCSDLAEEVLTTDLSEVNVVPKISTRKLVEAAAWEAAGLTVVVMKQSCSPRCIMETPDTPLARKLVDDFSSGKVLPIPHKSLTDAYIRILARCKALQAGRICGAEG